MSTHNICIHAEIREIAKFLVEKNSYLELCTIIVNEGIL